MVLTMSALIKAIRTYFWFRPERVAVMKIQPFFLLQINEIVIQPKKETFYKNHKMYFLSVASYELEII